LTNDPGACTHHITSGRPVGFALGAVENCRCGMYAIMDSELIDKSQLDCYYGGRRQHNKDVVLTEVHRTSPCKPQAIRQTSCCVGVAERATHKSICTPCHSRCRLMPPRQIFSTHTLTERTRFKRIRELYFGERKATGKRRMETNHDILPRDALV